MSEHRLQPRMLAAHKAVAAAASQIRSDAVGADLSPGQEDQLEALICEWEGLARGLGMWCKVFLEGEAQPSEPVSDAEYVTADDEGPMGEVVESCESVEE